MDDPRLTLEQFAREAREFATQLSSTVQAVAGPNCTKFLATIVPDGDNHLAVIRQEQNGIPLKRDGKVILRLEVVFWIIRDSRERYLRVRESQFKVLPAGANLPVFRYEYDGGKEQRPEPAAHLQVHGKHPDLERMMSDGGRPVSRSSPQGSGAPDICDLHFPVGGTRFRPCLEDVLEMLIHEFQIVPDPGRKAALDVLRTSREKWRTTQLKAIVRDDPATAVDTLRGLGYMITPPKRMTERNNRTFERL